MTPFLWFSLGALLGSVSGWLFSRPSRTTLRRLERLLPGHLRQESTTLPHRFKRLILDLENDFRVSREQLDCATEILDALPVGFLQVDQDNQIVSWNPKALELLGSREAEELAQGDRLVLEMVRSYDLDRLIAQVRRQGRLYQKDWVLKRVPSDRDSLEGLVESSQSLRGYGLPLSQSQVAVILEDRSEVDGLRQDRDRWTSDVAHEFKTPLTAIRLVSETLEMRVKDELRPWVQRLQSEVIRLNALVQDVLELNYGQRSEHEPKPAQKFDLSQQIQCAWMNLEPLAEPKDLSLYYDGPDILEMTGDQSGMYRVLLNLIDNAVKHSPEQGTIVVRLKPHASPEEANPLILPDAAFRNICPDKFCPQQPWIELNVIDMGHGLSNDVLPHVFKRFYRADESRVRPPRGTFVIQEQMQAGTGLGLAIAQDIVLAHRGQILAGNHPELKGAWFQIRIPMG